MDDASNQLWCRVVVRWPGNGARLVGAIGGVGRPDLGAVDRLARWALAARRSGADLVMPEVCDEMRKLLELAGLPSQVRGEVEDREDPLRVEKRVDGGDAAL
jgi:hypothetical protein